MLDCFKAQERVNGPKEQEDKTLRIKDTSGLHLYRVRPSHSFTPPPATQANWLCLLLLVTTGLHHVINLQKNAPKPRSLHVGLEILEGVFEDCYEILAHPMPREHPRRKIRKGVLKIENLTS